MTGEDITNIIVSFGLVGWIPIYFLFGRIAKVVCAIKDDFNKVNYDKERLVTYDDSTNEGGKLKE